MDRPIAEAAWSRLSERFGVANLFTIDFASDLQQRFDWQCDEKVELGAHLVKTKSRVVVKQSTWIGWVIIELIAKFIIELVANLITETVWVWNQLVYSMTEVRAGLVVHTLESTCRVRWRTRALGKSSWTQDCCMTCRRVSWFDSWGKLVSDMLCTSWETKCISLLGEQEHLGKADEHNIHCMTCHRDNRRSDLGSKTTRVIAEVIAKVEQFWVAARWITWVHWMTRGDLE